MWQVWPIAVETKWPTFWRCHFQIDFLCEYCFILIQISLKFYEQSHIICSNNDLASNKRYGIIWSRPLSEASVSSEVINSMKIQFTSNPSLHIGEVGCYMMTSSNGNIFCVSGPLWGEFTGHRWILLTKASDAELWCFVWSALEQTVEQTIGDLRSHRVHYDVTVLCYLCKELWVWLEQNK